MTQKLNDHLTTLHAFFTDYNLTVSTAKTTITLLTPHTAQANFHPQVMYNNTLLPLNKTPKLLGLTHDTMFCLGPHIRETASRTQQRNSILKALAGIDWGCDKETLTPDLQSHWTFPD